MNDNARLARIELSGGNGSVNHAVELPVSVAKTKQRRDFSLAGFEAWIVLS